MTRRRSNPHTKKQTKKNSGFKQNHLIYIAIILAITIASGAIIALQSNEEQNQNPSSSTKSDRWLFAMDTDNIGSKYQASSIPTIAIIDINGNIVYYNVGVHTKNQLLPYVESAEKGTAEILAAAPDFTVTTFNEKTFKLSDNEGKVVLIDLMAEYCGPCKTQMPELQKIKQEKGDDIIILSIDVAYPNESEELVRSVFGEYIKE